MGEQRTGIKINRTIKITRHIDIAGSIQRHASQFIGINVANGFYPQQVADSIAFSDKNVAFALRNNRG